MGNTTAKATVAREPRLTKEQLDAWADLKDTAWAPFKEAWLSRGLRLPPTPHQREFLWRVADARPNDLGTWVRVAPSPVADKIVEYVLTRWLTFIEGLNEDAEQAEWDWLQAKAAERAAARPSLEHIGVTLKELGIGR
jgi:hypothetical protein